MTNTDPALKNSIKEAVSEALNEGHGRTPAEVKIMFDWVSRKMKKEMDCALRRKKITDFVTGSLILAGVIWFFSMIGSKFWAIISVLAKNNG